jgi:hypothetical protein
MKYKPYLEILKHGDERLAYFAIPNQETGEIETVAGLHFPKDGNYTIRIEDLPPRMFLVPPPKPEKKKKPKFVPIEAWWWITVFIVGFVVVFGSRIFS